MVLLCVSLLPLGVYAAGSLLVGIRELHLEAVVLVVFYVTAGLMVAVSQWGLGGKAIGPLSLGVLLLPIVGLLLAGSFASTIRRIRRWQRICFCRGCGYNLTGNVSGICPECGSMLDAGSPRKG